MKKPNEIFEEHINNLIEYITKLKDMSKDLSREIEQCHHKDLETLGLMRTIYNEIFDDLCLIVKNTMKSAMKSKIKGDNISDNSITGE